MSCCSRPAGKQPQESRLQEDVKEYYGKILQSTGDLKTPACALPAKVTKKHVSAVVELLHDEVKSKYYGCGLILPDLLEGMNVVDLGSGSGRDCYVLAKLVGEEGFVTGIDMTDEQLETARKFLDFHRDAFGFKKSNVKFVKGYLEDIGGAGIGDGTVDIIVSNCVINLCKDKKSVLQNAFRVLKHGGELYFSDIYSDRKLSDEIRSHKVLWGECISGALHWKELYSLAKEIGFETPRTCSVTVFDIGNEELQKVVGDAKFISVLYHLFKLPPDAKREPSEVTYDGKVTGSPDKLEFDYQLTFIKDVPMVVDGDTAAILTASRFKDHFTFHEATSCACNQQEVEINPFEVAVVGDGAAGQCC